MAREGSKIGIGSLKFMTQNVDKVERVCRELAVLCAKKEMNWLEQAQGLRCGFVVSAIFKYLKHVSHVCSQLEIEKVS